MERIHKFTNTHIRHTTGHKNPLKAPETVGEDKLIRSLLSSLKPSSSYD